jgi:hypothetical protein
MPTAGMVNRPSLLEYCAGRSMVPQRAEIRPFPMRSDEDQGGSDRQCRLIQPSRHQIQLLTARPAPAEPHQYVARLECLVTEETQQKQHLNLRMILRRNHV